MLRRTFTMSLMAASLWACGDDTGGTGGGAGTGGSGGENPATTTTSGTGGGEPDSYFRYTAKGIDVDIPLAGQPLFSVGPAPSGTGELASFGLLAYDAMFTKTGAIAIYVPDAQTVPAGTYPCGDAAALSAAVDGHRGGSGVNVGEGGSCTITLDVTAEPGATVTGTFSGTLVANDQSTDPSDLVLTNGSFKATIPAAN